MADHGEAPDLVAQLRALPRLYVELIEACVDPEHTAGSEVGVGKRAGAEPLAAPLELNLTILDFVAEPDSHGRLGLVRTLVGIERVSRLALGSKDIDGFDRLTIGLRELKKQDLHERVSVLGEDRLVEASTVATTVRWLLAQVSRLEQSQKWTRGAAAAVRALYDEATVGIDDQLEEQWQEWRAHAGQVIALDQEIGAELAAGDVDDERRGELLLMRPTAAERADAGTALLTSLEEYIGRYLDSVHAWYTTAAAGPEQWHDFIREEIHRLYSRAEHLLGQTVHQRTRPCFASACPFCDTYSLVLVHRDPNPACARRTQSAIDRGEPPPPDRCCGEFVECLECSRRWSTARDTIDQAGRLQSEASMMFAAFIAAGWRPLPAQQAVGEQAHISRSVAVA